MQLSQCHTQPTTGLTPAERSTVKLFDEYADRERRKNNLINHNISENEELDLPVRNRDDTQLVQSLIENGLNNDGVDNTKAIRLGENKGTTPRLILATLDTPARKRVILVASKTQIIGLMYTYAQTSPLRRERREEQ